MGNQEMMYLVSNVRNDLMKIHKRLAVLEDMFSYEDEETGKIDIDRITTGVSSLARDRLLIVKKAFSVLEKKEGPHVVTDHLFNEVKATLSRDQFEETVEKMKRFGEVFEPRRGFLSRL